MRRNIIIPVMLFFYCCSNPSTAKYNYDTKEALPSFTVRLLNGVDIKSNDLGKGKPMIFLFLSPDCPFCRAMTNEITDNINSLKGIQFVIISPFPVNQIRTYSHDFNLEKYPNIIIGQDLNSFFEHHFKVKSVPFIVVYDESKRLKETFNGRVSIGLIKSIALN